MVLVGSGDGIVDAAAAGLLDGSELVRYSGSLAADEVAPVTAAASTVIVTDSNRDRAHHWRSSQDVVGLTEDDDPAPDVLRVDPADERLPVFGTTGAPATVAVQEGPVRAHATAYGEPFAYRPEDRPVMAIDGDPTTAWVVGDRADPRGEQIRLDVDAPIDHLTLVQPTGAADQRHLARVSVAVDDRAPDRRRSRRAVAVRPTGQRVDLAPTTDRSTVTITILDVASPTAVLGPALAAVGFAEIDTGLGPTVEVVRPPADAADVLAAAPDTPVSFVLTRLRTRPTDRWRADPEPTLRRDIDLPAGRTFDPAITVRLDQRASDDVLADLLGIDGPRATDRLTGVAGAAGWAATDGDLGHGVADAVRRRGRRVPRPRQPQRPHHVHDHAARRGPLADHRGAPDQREHRRRRRRRSPRRRRDERGRAAGSRCRPARCASRSRRSTRGRRSTGATPNPSCCQRPSPRSRSVSRRPSPRSWTPGAATTSSPSTAIAVPVRVAGRRRRSVGRRGGGGGALRRSARAGGRDAPRGDHAGIGDRPGRRPGRPRQRGAAGCRTVGWVVAGGHGAGIRAHEPRRHRRRMPRRLLARARRGLPPVLVGIDGGRRPRPVAARRRRLQRLVDRADRPTRRRRHPLDRAASADARPVVQRARRHRLRGADRARPPARSGARAGATAPRARHPPGPVAVAMDRVRALGRRVRHSSSGSGGRSSPPSRRPSSWSHSGGPRLAGVLTMGILAVMGLVVVRVVQTERPWPDAGWPARFEWLHALGGFAAVSLLVTIVTGRQRDAPPPPTDP